MLDIPNKRHILPYMTNKTDATTKPADFGTLMPDYKNHYYRVTNPFTVWAMTGKHLPTGAWYGASQIHIAETQVLRLTAGDQVHALVGGTFVITKSGEVFEVKMTRPSADGVFCHNSGDWREQNWPLRRLREIQNPKPVSSYRRSR